MTKQSPSSFSYGQQKQSARAGIIISVLLVIIFLLVGVISYFFLVRPSVTGYVVQKQIEAQNALLTNMLLQIQQQGFLRIADDQGNELVLVPYQQPAPQQQAPQQAQQPVASGR